MSSWNLIWGLKLIESELRGLRKKIKIKVTENDLTTNKVYSTSTYK